MKKLFFLLFALWSASGQLKAAETILLSEGFESGKGAWIFSTSAGGNDWGIVNLMVGVPTGYNSANSVQCKTIGAKNFLISPAVTFTANKPYKVRFWAKEKAASSRKIEVYYNSTNTVDGNEVLVGTTPLISTQYTQYTIDFANPPAGVKYIILKGVIATGMSSWVYLNVDNIELAETDNFKPTVSVSTPLDSATHTAGTTLPITVAAADADGTISKVELYYRGELYGSDTSSPYTFSVTNLQLGGSLLYAVATDNKGDFTTSTPITVIGINTPPTCTLTSPASDVTIAQGSTVNFAATASDTDGTISSVAFKVNGATIATDDTAPYTYSWNNPNAGVYTISATATDNTGLSTSSTISTITSTPTTTGYLMDENFESGTGNWIFSTNSGGNDWKSSIVGMNGTKGIIRHYTIKNVMKYTTSMYFASSTYTVKLQAYAATANKCKFQAGVTNGVDTIWGALTSTFAPITNYALQTMTFDVTTSGYYNLVIRSSSVTPPTFTYLYVDDINLWGLGGTYTNLPPVTSFTTPVNASSVALNAVVPFTASAYDADGTVSKVEFFVGSTKIGEDLTSPYSLNWTATNPGVYSIKSVATDNGGGVSTKVNTLFVNYADRTVYDISASSYLGGEANSGRVWGTAILSDGVIVLACDWGSVIPANTVVHLLNGATLASRGTIVRMAADGKKILSITKIGNYAVDISTDNSDNIYVAAGNSGLLKLNRLADQVVYAKTFSKNVYRVDAGKTGYVIVLTRAGEDFEGKKWDYVTNIVLSPAGSVLTSFGGASNYSNDVCIDEATQSAVVVGWRNVYTGDGVTYNLPVDIPGFKVFNFSGGLKYNGYNWSSDRTSPNWINASDNNMADSRIARCDIGEDGLLYYGGECSGGNHPFRYSPFDIMTKVPFVGGDNYHVLTFTGTEFHTYIGRLNLTNGAYITGQTFTARLGSGAGSTLDMEHGNLAADAEGRLYFTGQSYSGTPLSQDRLAGQLGSDYTGGAFIYIMNPTLEYRELVDRVIVKNYGRDIAVKKFANFDQTIVYGGDVDYQDETRRLQQTTLYAVNPVQADYFGNDSTDISGFVAVIGGTAPKSYTVTSNGIALGSFVECTKLTLTAPATSGGLPFTCWTGGKGYISDSTVIAATYSVPGKNSVLVPVYGTYTSVKDEMGASLQFYPNPARESIMVTTGSAIAMPLTIVDMNGRTLVRTTVTSSASIPVNQLSKGVYILNVGTTNKKLVIY